MRILGIDPGLDAFGCIYQPEASLRSGMRWHFLDIPTSGDKAGRRIDAPKLLEWIQRYAPDFGYVENVGPMRGQGLGHTSRFLRACGSIEGLVAISTDFRLVAPQTWKRYYEIPSYENKLHAKEHSRQLALQLWPELAPVLTRKGDHGRAEAALIAAYGAEKQKPIR